MGNNSSSIFVWIFAIFMLSALRLEALIPFVIMFGMYSVFSGGARKARQDRRHQREERGYDRRQERTYERREERKKKRPYEREYRRSQPTKRPVAKPKPKNNPYKQSGIKKYKDFEYEESIKDFEKALSIDPSDIAVHFNIACAYSLTEQTDKAFEHISKAVENGFKDFDKIQDHDAFAYLRIQDEFEAFAKNGYKLSGSAGSGPQASSPQEQNNLLEQLQKLAELRERGLLTADEFEIQKKKLLG